MRREMVKFGGARLLSGHACRVLMLMMLLAWAAGAAADDVLPLYFEWGPPLHDYLNLGGGDINPSEFCSNASGNLAVGGFDTVGEWIEVQLTVAAAGEYALEASFKGEFGQQNSLALSLRPAAGGAAQGTAISFYGAGFD